MTVIRKFGVMTDLGLIEIFNDRSELKKIPEASPLRGDE